MVKYVDYFGHRVSRQWNRILRAADASGVAFHLDSGHRTMAEQAQLVREKGVWSPSNPHGAAVPSPTAPHIRVGRADHAIDVNQLDGGAQRLAAWLRKRGVKVTFTVPPEPWHMEADAHDLKRFSDKLEKAARRKQRVKHAKKVVRRRPKPKVAQLIDVSSVQGVVDFHKVKAAGYDGIIAKASEGQDFTDARFTANVRAARAAGLKVGAYHFLRPRAGRSGAVEAKWFMKHLRATRLGKGDIRPVLDVETTALADAATATYVSQAVAALRKAGYRPMIYTFPAFRHWTSSFGCPLWVAHFGVDHPTIPAPWKRYYIWQHSSSGSVPGVSGHVDLNVCPDLHKILA